MTILEREFYRSARGPLPGDEDIWRLVFDGAESRLVVRHEWRTSRHSGAEDVSVDEFLAEPSAARDGLIAFLFERELIIS
jgi:hypothetical protein